MEAAPSGRLQRILATVAESGQLPGGHHRLLLDAPAIAVNAQPGQFLHIWCHPPEEINRPPAAAILRRPLSISRFCPPDGVEVLFRVRGAGGRLLAAKTVGDQLDIIGPLGRGFRISDTLQTAVIVTGGIGIAPIPGLLQALVARGIRALVLAGARDDATIPFSIARPRAGRATIPALEQLGAETIFVSETVEGVLITEVVDLRLGEFGEGTEFFAVGPRAMLKRLVAVTGEHLPLQVSLEERMACGIGACRSCVVPVTQGSPTGYLTVCRDGPVFDAAVIDWERLEP